jgi:AcrR family transcriptional regulator
MATRTRLSREARQDQLLDLGAELFADRSYEEVHIEELAEVAGVSRGLLYHYFPTKRAFFAAMVRREAGRILEMTDPDPTLPVAEQLRGGIETYLDYCQAHRFGVKAAFRGGASADEEVQEIIGRDVDVQVERIIDAVQPHRPDALLRLAVRGWVQMLRATTHDWLDLPEVSRDELRDLMAAALIATLGALPEASRPAGVADLLG